MHCSETLTRWMEEWGLEYQPSLKERKFLAADVGLTTKEISDWLFST